MGQPSAPVDPSPATEDGRLYLLAWMKPSLHRVPQHAVASNARTRPTCVWWQVNRAMEVSGGGNLRNAMIGLLA